MSRLKIGCMLSMAELRVIRLSCIARADWWLRAMERDGHLGEDVMAMYQDEVDSAASVARKVDELELRLQDMEDRL